MLGVIKLAEEGASWKENKELQSPCTDSINSFLVECNGNQLSVFERPFGKWVRVFKMKAWEITCFLLAIHRFLRWQTLHKWKTKYIFQDSMAKVFCFIRWKQKTTAPSKMKW